MANKFYVVKKGRVPGIYLSWAECLRQVDAFSGAVYKSYNTRQEAEEAFESSSLTATSSVKTAPKKRTSATSKADSGLAVADNIRLRIYCDGACQGNPGRSGSGLAIYEDDKKPVLIHIPADLHYTLKRVALDDNETLTAITERQLRAYLVAKGYTKFA